ncbi:MAG: pyrroline-5-carboxylate reductase [Muribaculaceae bacterium]|nr:pyrroline-5-carboxylate reductase [Muribaculaceae bacterium]
MQRIAIIGAGNMGSTIARGFLSQDNIFLTLANRSVQRLQKFENLIENSAMSGRLICTPDIADSVKGADIVILAVKPWAIEDVIGKIKPCLNKNAIIISVAAGIGLAQLEDMLGGKYGGIVYMIPNTAIQVNRGMSFAAETGLSAKNHETVAALFEPMTRLEFIDESKMGAVTALCSCGIAYVYKFIAAAAQAGVELGLPYNDAVDYFTATVAGAAAMIEHEDLTVQEHINAVTTPGGMTIRGINALERNGFPAAVIESIKQSLKK